MPVRNTGSFTCARLSTRQTSATVMENARLTRSGAKFWRLPGRKSSTNAATKIVPARAGTYVAVVLSQTYQKNAGQEQRSGISRLWKNDPVTREAMVSCHLLAPKRKESGVAVSRGITRTRNDRMRKGPQPESITARAMTESYCLPGNRSDP